MSTRFATSQRSDMRPLSYNGIFVSECYDLLQNIFEKNRDFLSRHGMPDADSFLAEPMHDPETGCIDWYYRGAGTPAAVDSLTGAEKIKAADLQKNCASAMQALAEKLSREPGMETEAAVLREALKHPGTGDLYMAGHHLLLKDWGYAPGFSEAAPQDIMRYGEKLAVPAHAKSAAAVPPAGVNVRQDAALHGEKAGQVPGVKPENRPLPGLTPKPGCLSWLLPLLLGLLLLWLILAALGLLPSPLPAGCFRQDTNEAALQEQLDRARNLQQEQADLAGALQQRAAQCPGRARVAEPVILPGAVEEEVPAAGVLSAEEPAVSLGAEEGAEEGPMAEGPLLDFGAGEEEAVPADEEEASGSQPAAEASQAGGEEAVPAGEETAAGSQPAEENGVADEDGTEEPVFFGQTQEDLQEDAVSFGQEATSEVEADAVARAAANAAGDAAGAASKAQGQDGQDEAAGTADTVRKNARGKAADAKMDIKFLSGCWRSTDPLYKETVHGQQLVVEYCFDEKGQGARYHYPEDGGGAICTSPARAKFRGQTVDLEADAMTCLDGQDFTSQNAECWRNGSRIQCRGAERLADGATNIWDADFTRTK